MIHVYSFGEQSVKRYDRHYITVWCNAEGTALASRSRGNFSALCCYASAIIRTGPYIRTAHHSWLQSYMTLYALALECSM